MIQDIDGKQMIAFCPGAVPGPEDHILHFKGREILVSERGEFPGYSDFGELKECVYAFSMEGKAGGRYFLCLADETEIPEGFAYVDLRELRRRTGYREASSFEDMCFNPFDRVYAAFTAFHLDNWYRTTRYCGRCAARMQYGKKERVMECPSCGNLVYPRINPAVIVGVLSPDRQKLLVTRYARSRGVHVWALVAGFTEIGETLEDTVQREVMEEVGLRVKNIRYYKSQPWGIAADMLAGFFCEAEEGQEIRLDTSELRVAEWQTREEITGQPDNLSLTNEMMMYFRAGLA